MPQIRAPLRTSRSRLPLGGVLLAGFATATAATAATAGAAPAEGAGGPPAEPTHAPSAAAPTDAVAPSASARSGAQMSALDFDALYRTWFRKVQRWVRVLGGSAIDVDNLTQEVFLVAYRKLDQFDGANVGAWLYRITRLIVSDQRQRVWFRKIVLRAHDVTLDDYESAGVRQDEQLDDKKRERSFYRLVMQLNPKWRDSFLLFEIAGLSGHEIATLQGIPAATVRTHLARARKKMAELAAKLQHDTDLEGAACA